jgi:hypothetical protein
MPAFWMHRGTMCFRLSWDHGDVPGRFLSIGMHAIGRGRPRNMEVRAIYCEMRITSEGSIDIVKPVKP